MTRRTTDCRCGSPAHHCSSGHHHVVPGLAEDCDRRLDDDLGTGDDDG